MTFLRPLCGERTFGGWYICNLHKGHAGDHACTHSGWQNMQVVYRWAN